jgi:hypothetical protein
MKDKIWDVNVHERGKDRKILSKPREKLGKEGQIKDLFQLKIKKSNPLIYLIEYLFAMSAVNQSRLLVI